ncbi:hypothetical protein RJ640_021929 [Escallonia rubra]|uniref:Retrotransposon Copia-like N-terminal domain-containing protein n=1 Tax=Escallonia rubra TaxID=112253 RepID=A0AA88R9D6_9ASTE|nr:hypothetical protein RJ640_021929 [Escallonia rubra]
MPNTIEKLNSFVVMALSNNGLREELLKGIVKLENSILHFSACKGLKRKEKIKRNGAFFTTLIDKNTYSFQYLQLIDKHLHGKQVKRRETETDLDPISHYDTRYFASRNHPLVNLYKQPAINNFITSARNHRKRLSQIMNKTLTTATQETLAAPIDIKQEDSNYGLWSQVVEMYISGKDKLGYINGDLPQPQETYPSFRKWRTENAVVKSWLINSMDPKLISNYIRFRMAKAI